MKYLFIPRWSGDFRLEDKGGHSLLTVENPTDGDRDKLVPFLATARSRGWISPEEGVARTGRSEILIPHPMATVAPVMAAILTDPNRSWSALRYTDGTVEVIDGNTLPALRVPPAKGTPENPIVEAKGVIATVKEKVIEAVAVVTPPYRGCPEPEPRARRASTVLRTFCTADQWSSFARLGYLHAIGPVSGRLYRVWHEGAANAAKMRRCLTLEDGTAVCAWENSVPPEEQALALKLAVEHREAWLLHVGHGQICEDKRDVRRFA